MKAGGTLLVLTATCGLALKGVWARLAYAAGLDVPGVLFYRSALAAPLVVASTFWLLRREARALHARGASPRPVPRAEWLWATAFGAFFAIGMYFDFTAIARLGAGVSRVILFGFPLLVMVLESTVQKKLPSGKKVLGFLVAWSGLLCVASPAFLADAQWGPRDLMWGFLSMGTYAFYVYLTGRLSQTMGSVRLSGASNLATAAVVVTTLLVQGGGSAPPTSPNGLLWVLVMVLVSTVFPYFMMMEGIRRLGSSEASLLAMSGPLVTLFASYWILSETMTLVQGLGTALTLLGVGVATSKLPALGLRSLRSST